MSSSPVPLVSFAALAANLAHPASTSATLPPTATAHPAPSPTDVIKQQNYHTFAVHSPMSTASTASDSDSASTAIRSTQGSLITSRCSTPDRLHSPLSLDTATATSSAASSRAPSPACSHLTLNASPSTRGFSVAGPSSHASSIHASISPAISPVSHPTTPPSPAHSSASVSSSASSEHSTDAPGSSVSTPTASSSSSTSSNYRPDRRSSRSKRIPLSASQKTLLEDFFRTNHYPTRDEKTELGNKIGLSSDKVHKWSINTHTRPQTRCPVCSTPPVQHC